MPVRLRAAAALPLLLLTACPPASPEARVSADAVLLREFGPRPRQAGKADDSLTVLDAAVDGQRVAVLVREGYGDTATFQRDLSCVGFCTPTGSTAGGGLLDRLVVSDDLGATWRAVPLDELPMGMTYQGLHLAGGRAVLVTRSPSEFRYFEFDVTTGRRVPNAEWEALASIRPPLARGGRLGVWGSFSFGVDSYFESLLIDLLAGTTIASGFANTLSQLGAEYPLPTVGPSASRDGQTWWTTKASEAYRPGDFCLMTTRLSAGVLPKPQPAGCVRQVALPTSFTLSTPVVAPGGQLALLAIDRQGPEGSDRLWWWPILGTPDPTQIRLLPSGLATVLDDKAVHASMGGGIVFSRAAPDQRREYLRWTGAGFEALDFPALCSPPGCEEVLTTAVPLAGDEWLLFYSADVSATRAQQELRVFARRASVPARPVELSATMPGLGDVVPGADPAGPLERACTHLAACGMTASFRDCLQTWAAAASCGNAQPLLLASSGGGTDDCPALRAAAPAACPAGTTCQASENTCTAEGNARLCLGRSGLAPAVEACSALGLGCASGVCVGATPAPDCTSGPFNWQRCVGGRYLTWCATPSARHALDCGALGFSGCVDVVQQPGMPNIPARCE
jgi:hypothetical protein